MRNRSFFEDAELEENEGSFGENEDSDIAFSLDDIGSAEEDTEANSNEGTPLPKSKETKKISIILIAILFVIVLVVVFVASKLSNAINKDDSQNTVVQEQVVEQKQTTTNKKQSQSDTTQTQVQTQSTNQSATSSKQSSSADEYGWTELKDVSDISFNEEPKEMMFTVTEVHMYARQVGSNGLNVKTTLVGSLAGLSGTYTIDVPYDKGSKISIGTEFTVHVQLGEYSGKTVVGEISYR